MSQSTSEPATTFDSLTLGRAVKLGELYDARKDQFLSVQMYSNAQITGATTMMDVKYTELGLKMSNSYEEKAALIDVNAQLSLEILSGLVTVKGSAAYLNDTRSNTQEKSWVMYLKQRLTEERLLFAEEDLGYNILSYAKDNYIATGLATHFVSSVVYGGDVVINLVARMSKLTEEEKIEGSLQAELQLLKGVIDLNAEASAEIKAEFANLDDKFEIAMHGDITLTRVPVNPADVLDIFPQACSLIGAGVPISVTLQPIPQSLVSDAILINQIEAKLLADLLKAFSNLDDVRSRFDILQFTSNVYKDLIPSLVNTVTQASSAFGMTHRTMITKLAKCIRELRSTTGSTTEDTASLITETEILYNEHTSKVESYHAPTYPFNLASLEAALVDFELLIAVVENAGLHLTTLRDVVLNVMKYSSVALALMSSLYTDGDSNLIIFSSLAPAVHTAYNNQNPPLPDYCLYVEDPAVLERRLPNDDKFANLVAPAIYVGTKEVDGTVTWQLVTMSEVLALIPKRLYHLVPYFQVNEYNRMTTARPQIVLDKLDSAKSFSVTMSGCITIPSQAPILLLSSSTWRERVMLQVFASNKIDMSVWVSGHGWLSISQNKTAAVSIRTDFSVAFVQNVQTNRWIFYLNGQKINDRPIIADSFGQLTLTICRLFSDPPYNIQGMIYEASIYSGALTDVDLLTTVSTSTLKANEMDENPLVRQAFDPIEGSEERDVETQYTLEANEITLVRQAFEPIEGSEGRDAEAQS